MQSAIGVPHREVAVVLSSFSCGNFAAGKGRITAIHIAHFAREEAAAIECAIELVHFGDICILYIDGVQTVYPLLGCLGHHTLKVVSLCLEGKVVVGSLFRCER